MNKNFGNLDIEYPRNEVGRLGMNEKGLQVRSL